MGRFVLTLEPGSMNQIFPNSITSFVAGDEAHLIRDAIEEIESKSCLEFVKRKSSDENWIRFEVGEG